MATITKYIGTSGATTYKVRIRILGCPALCKSFSRLTDAKEWASSRESALRENRDFPERVSGKRTVNDAIAEYKKEGFKEKEGSEKKQSSQLDWWAGEIGHVLLSHLTPAMICASRSKLRSGKTNRRKRRSNATVNRYTAALSALLTACVSEWHWIMKNPMHQIPQLKEGKGRSRFLSKDELLRLAKACQASRNRYLLTIFLLAVSTGLRKSEALRLTWDDIDFDRRTAYVQESKNGEPRTLPLEGAVWESIVSLYKSRRIESDLLFPGKNPLNPMEFRTAWENAIKKAQIKNFRWHDNRHTTGSYLAMSGATLAEIADILGHKTIIVAKRYSHHSDKHKRGKVTEMNKSHIPDNFLALVEGDEEDGKNEETHPTEPST